MSGMSLTNHFSVLRIRNVILSAAIFLILGSTAPVAQTVNERLDPVGIFNAAQDLHERGDLKGAVSLYERAIATLPEFPEAEYQLGMAFLALRNVEAAEKAFRRALELRQHWTLPMARLGSILIERGRNDEALSLLEKVVEIEPQNPAALTALTELRIATGASTAVLRNLLSTISEMTAKANPTVSLWTARAALEMSLGQHEMAKSSLVKALTLEPDNRLALAQLGDISLADGDITAARKIVARLDADREPFGPHLILKASVLAFDGRFDEAMTLLDTFKGTSTRADELRSRIRAARSTDPRDLEKQLEKNGRDVAILGRLCSMYRLFSPSKALEYCRRASEVEPGNVSHAVGFGAALVQAKEYEAAVDILRKLISIAPDNSTARANLATALFQLKRYPEAKTEFIWLTNTQPKAPGAYYFLGIVHDHMTEYMDAAANYQQYLRLADPVQNKTDIERVNLRMPVLQRLIKEGKGKK